MSDSDSGGSEFEPASGSDYEDNNVDIEGDESDDEMASNRKPRHNFVIPETPPKPPKPSLTDINRLNLSSTYDSDDVSPSKEPSGPQVGSTWTGKPTDKYSGRRTTGGGLLDRVFAAATKPSAPAETGLQRTLDQFKFRPSATSGKRPRPEHPDPSDVNADEWVETRPEKRQKLDDNDEDANILSPQPTPQKDLKRLRPAGEFDPENRQEVPQPRRLPPSLFSNSSAIPPGRTMRRRTAVSYAPPKPRRNRDSSDEDSMKDFIVDSDEDEEQRAARHKRYRNNAAYNPDLDDADEEEPVLDDDAARELEELEEQEEELERKSKKMRHAKKKAAAVKASKESEEEETNGDSQSSGRLRRLRKTRDEPPINHAEPLILDISDDDDAVAPSSSSKPVVLDIAGSDDENNNNADVMILDEEDEEEEAGEASSSEDVADEETIASLDSIIQQTEDYTSKLRKRLAEMKIDDKKNSIAQSEDGLYERAPSCLKHKLKDYQLIGINWMYCLNQLGLNGILADEMGLGKTIQSIALLALMYEKGDYGPHLVVVPASTLSNWERELRKWAPVMNVCQYYGSQQDRSYIQDDISRQRKRCSNGKWLKDNYNIVLTTYQMATRKEDSGFLRKFQFSYMILDEAQNIKNQGSMRYKNLFRQKTKHRILLTGTPLQNNLDELWALLQFLMPQLFAMMDFKPISSQLARLKRTTPQQGKRVESKYVQRMKRCLQPFILRRLKMQIGLHLQPKTIDISKCSLTEEQRAVYQQIFNRSRVAFLKQQTGEQQAVSMSHFLQNVLMQLRKTANHPVLVRAFYTEDQIAEIAKLLKVKHDDWRADPLEHIMEDLQAYSDFQIHTLARTYSYLSQFKLSNDLLFNTSGKFLALSTLLPQLISEGHRILLFSQMTRMLDVMEPYLDHMGISFVRLDGNTPVGERQVLIDDFNSDDSIKVFLLSTRAGGLGINLTSADTVIFYDIAFNPQVDRQAEDRCHRLGQEKAVRVIKLIVSGSCEEQIFDMAREKHELNDVVLGEGKYADTQSTKGLPGSDGSDAPSDDAAKDEEGNEPAGVVVGDDVEVIDEDAVQSLMGNIFGSQFC